MVSILRLYQGGQGPGHLPDDGGILDQSVLMLDALNLMAGFEYRINEKDAPQYGDDGEPEYAAHNRSAINSWLQAAGVPCLPPLPSH
jgi:hypothetical protein